MKKFSVIVVAMLIALMLFVGCENKPKERAATTDDMKVFGLLSNAAYSLAFSDAEGVDPTITKNKISVVFTNAEYNDGYYSIRLNGTFVAEGNKQSGKMKLDLTSGTSINGKGHTLYAEGSSGGVPEIILDGYRLTGLDKLFASSQPDQNESPSGNPGQSGSSSDYSDFFESIIYALSMTLSSESYPNVEFATSSSKIIISFNHAEVRTENGTIILNGTYEINTTNGSFIINMTSGTSINGEGHTLYVKGSSYGNDIEVFVDGNKVADPENLFGSLQPGQSGSPSENPGQSESPSGNPGQSESPSGNPGQNESPSGNPGQTESPSGNPGQSGSSSDYLDIYKSISYAIANKASWGNLPNVNVVTTASKLIVSFNHAEVRTEKGTVILNGTYEINNTNGSFIINMTSGTKINGKSHTLYVKGSLSGKTPEVIIDGEKVTLY
ncbi:MAG: hypothetical protein SO157_06650 [Bullifex sp.]|nr:hypothetical protein [Bullifex sp.]